MSKKININIKPKKTATQWSFTSVLALIFIVTNITGITNVPWWIVIALFFAPLIITAIIFGVACIIGLIMFIIAMIRNR